MTLSRLDLSPHRRRRADRLRGSRTRKQSLIHLRVWHFACHAQYYHNAQRAGLSQTLAIKDVTFSSESDARHRLPHRLGTYTQCGHLKTGHSQLEASKVENRHSERSEESCRVPGRMLRFAHHDDKNFALPAATTAAAALCRRRLIFLSYAGS